MPPTPPHHRILRAATTALGVVVAAFLAVVLAPAAQAAETFVPISADTGFVPISADTGFVPISADTGFVPISADTGFVPIAVGGPTALAGSWHLSSTGYWTKFLCEKAGQVQWPLFPTECTRDGSRWAMWVWY